MLRAGLAITFERMPADLPVHAALDYARAAVFSRAVEVSFAPDLLTYVETMTDIRRPRCRQITAKRVGCTYRFTVQDIATKALLYEERGTLRLSRRSTRLEPTSEQGATRDHLTR